MLIDKILQGRIKDLLCDLFNTKVESDAICIDDDQETIVKELAEDCLEIVMGELFRAGYYVIEGSRNILAAKFGIDKEQLPETFLILFDTDVQLGLQRFMTDAYAHEAMLIPRARIANLFGTLTTKHYWDCECEENYIHHKSVEGCLECGCHKKDQPDSFLREVIRKGML